MPAYYPLFLNLEGKRVLIFGGGKVAQRKAKALAKAKADITAISRDFSNPFLRLAKQYKLKIKRGSQIPKSLTSYALVITATSDPAFNRHIAKRCQAQGIWVNVADQPERSTFIVPSTIKRGALQVAISTGGASPFLAKMLRQKLEREFGAQYKQLVHELKKNRNRIKQTLSSQAKRKQFFRKWVQVKLGNISK